MHLFLRHLRNAIAGGLLGLAAGGIAVWAIARSLRPSFTEDDYPAAMSGAYMIGIFLGMIVGLVVYLTLTRRAVRHAKEYSPPPEPPPNDPHVWPPPPTRE